MSAADSEKRLPDSLPVLRALIDTLDHEILHKLAQRDELVARVADAKRHTGTMIRDTSREAALLADRRRVAEKLGLRPDVAESLFRMVLWASRDRQAALRAELAPDTETKTVAIIGGEGGMGRCMASLFGDLGHSVLSADLNTPLAPADAARAADVVVISVPISNTEAVIREIGPLVKPEGLLLDVTSIKQRPMETMLTSTPAAVVGTHPLFGPGVHSLQGQRMVLVPGRGDAWFAWLKQMFHARGLQIVESSAEKHDRMMAIVQVLVHFNTEVLGKTLTSVGIPIAETLQFTSPIYLIKLILAARHFGQSADLYADIEMSNADTAAITEQFLAAARDVADTVNRQDRSAFQGLFDEVRAYFGDFIADATAQSSYLIDRIVERQ